MFPSSYNGFKFHEPAPHYKITNFGAMSQVSLTMNNDSRKKLPADVLAIIDEVAKEYEIVSTQNSMDKELSGLDNMAKTGAIITEMTRNAQASWATLLIDWPNERAGAISDQEGIDGKTIMRRYIELLAADGHHFPVDYPIN